MATVLNNKQRPKAGRSDIASSRKLTGKQQRFIQHYTDPESKGFENATKVGMGLLWEVSRFASTHRRRGVMRPRIHDLVQDDGIGHPA